MDPSTGYQECERIVRTRARNFAYGIRLLPPPKRRALNAIYAFARRVDDIGDGTDPADVRLARLAETRARLAALPAHGGDPVLVALADAVRRYPIPVEAFGEIVDGCESDVRGASYATFDELVGYCRSVAGSVGRLCLGAFGTGDREAAEPLADALGVALQLTNILRDVREDAETGRVYLPAKDLARYGCTLHFDPRQGFTDEPDRLAELVRAEARRAREWYATGLRLLPLLDRRSAACTAAMAGIYRRLLDRIEADPGAALCSRTSLPAWQKLAVAGRALSGVER
ncbi:presqualene diphosphate synthase HpnD [Actinomadura viridis]|uniref:Phytoene synthase n=1 Tax=Actinomadura viridis TaxID=58110 RepID=A0A931DIH8_9ACTN|nr:presqualene diphosphate synthase HpnD [Actinomadura viridis]MBG6091814.1 phytoene synthase [Actinomadura viridis]